MQFTICKHKFQIKRSITAEMVFINLIYSKFATWQSQHQQAIFRALVIANKEHLIKTVRLEYPKAKSNPTLKRVRHAHLQILDKPEHWYSN